MKIDIYLTEKKSIDAPSKVIGKTYENNATVLSFNLTDDLLEYAFYLDIEKPDGTKYTTAQLSIVNNKVEYELTNSVLDQDGFLKVEVILRNANDVVIKYPTLIFKIENAINATEELPSSNPTLLGQIQDVIDTIDTTGDGTKYLSDDGTYKTVASGTTNYNTLDNKPIAYLTGTLEEPIYFNELENGLYILNGNYSPYENADLSGEGTNLFLQVIKDETYVHISYDDLINNEIDYYKVNIDGSNYETHAYNLENLEPRETIITSVRTTISTTLYDRYSYQVSSIPTRILLNFDANRSAGYKCSFVFKTGDTIPTFSCDYEIKWHGDSITNNAFVINTNKSYTIDFWQDVNNFNANVREV